MSDSSRPELKTYAMYLCCVTAFHKTKILGIVYSLVTEHRAGLLPLKVSFDGCIVSNTVILCISFVTEHRAGLMPLEVSFDGRIVSITVILCISFVTEHRTGLLPLKVSFDGHIVSNTVILCISFVTEHTQIRSGAPQGFL